MDYRLVVVVLGVPVIILIIAWLLVRLGDWSNAHEIDSAPMKFKTWLDLFYLNPEAWSLAEEVPRRRKPSGWTIPIKFSFVDFLRYRRWHQKWRKAQRQRHMNESLAEALQLAQEDIRKLQQQADIEMQAAERKVRDAHERIKEDSKW